MSKSYRFSLKLVSIVTIIAFLATQVAWGYGDGPLSKAIQNSHIRIEQANQAGGAGDNIGIEWAEESSWRRLSQGIISENVNVERLVLLLRKYLFIESPSGDEAVIRDEIEKEIRGIFGETVEIIKPHTGTKNLVCIIKSNDERLEKLPAIILNTHMDAYPHRFRALDLEEKAVYHQGVDDACGLAVIIEALYSIKNRSHREIRLIFDAEEENRSRGMSELAENRNYDYIFKGVEVAITIDGPIDWEKIAKEILKWPIPDEDYQKYKKILALLM